MTEFNDEPGYPIICIKCAQPKVISAKLLPRDGDPYICTRCSEQVEDEFEPDKPENGGMV